MMQFCKWQLQHQATALYLFTECRWISENKKISKSIQDNLDTDLALFLDEILSFVANKMKQYSAANESIINLMFQLNYS